MGIMSVPPNAQPSRQEVSKFRDSLHKRIPRSDTKVQGLEDDQIEYVIVAVRIDA